LTSASIRQLVCIEGVATKVSTIKPKVVQSVHYCENTQRQSQRKYVDATDPELGLPELTDQGTEQPDRVVQITSTVYPTKDTEGNPLETEFGLSTFKDYQTISLQEMPEKAPMGQLPRSVELVLEHDLVDRIKPGDRVMVMGVYRALSNASSGQQTSAGVFRTVVLVNNVQTLGRDVSHLHFAPPDIRAIRELAQRPDILDVLGGSVAPSIHGHAVIKKALALQLLSGVEKNLDNGTHLRGDINILMVGDPSTAKSQLLRSAMTVAPLAVSTTGKGSSGVGLTAAVTSDPDTRERRLEAGAMVLGDRGLVCVDEFDKMGEGDRVALHEAMEQQTVTIAKAGIHASLHARCSVLAAANPVYGQYDRSKRLQENIGLPDSLLSRFDLLFVVLDLTDASTDRQIAQHVVSGHRRYGADATDRVDDVDEDSDDEDEAAGIWQDEHILQHDFLRKYLHFAKTRMQPVLTEQARDVIASSYAELRARQDDRTLPVTARSLETVIRLATAHAKARLSATVEEEDVAQAMDILRFALYHEQSHNNNKRSAPAVSDDEQEEPTPVRPRRNDDVNSGLEIAKQRIWSVLQEQGGELDPSTLDDEDDDEGILQSAVDALVKEGRVMVSDGMVYQL
jgi:DNA replication licensing factor MCM3